MNSERTQKLRRIYGILLSCVIILAGICLMVACVGIYRSGDEPFSRESVAAAFSPISIPVYLCLAMVLAGFVLKAILPVPAVKAAAAKQLSVTWKRLHARADLENCNSAVKSAIVAEQKRRNKQRIICAIVFAASSLVFLIYALDASHFHPSEINDSMVQAMWILIPCVIVSFAACLITVSIRNKSLQREIELLKQCPKLSAAKPEAVKPDVTKKIRTALLIVAAALAVFGFVAGGTADVLTKAVNICTECIGLG